jgi:hypothetical protein
MWSQEFHRNNSQGFPGTFFNKLSFVRIAFCSTNHIIFFNLLRNFRFPNSPIRWTIIIPCQMFISRFNSKVPTCSPFLESLIFLIIQVQIVQFNSKIIPLLPDYTM